MIGSREPCSSGSLFAVRKDAMTHCRKPRHRSFAVIFARIVVAGALATGFACAAETVRVAAQKTGTLGWELAVIKAHNLDREAGLRIEALELASPEAGKIALRGGSVDVI